MSTPVISQDFFQFHPPALALFEKWKSRYDWNASLLPIYEWEDVLFVGCVQEPISGPRGVQVVYVEVPAEILNNLWENWQHSPQESAASFQPEELQLNLNSVPGRPEDLENPLLEESSEASSSESSNFADNSSTDEEAFEPLDLNPEEPKAPAQPEIATAVATPPPPATKAAPPPPPATPIASPAAESPTDRKVAQILKGVRDHYQKAMIFSFDGNEFKPWKWIGFHRTSGSLNFYKVDQPSPFRAVARTLKSYHGLMVANPITEKFLEEWNGGEPPDVLTLAPMVQGETLFGLILLTGSAEANTKLSLQAAEKAARELVELANTKAAA
jgi:hypothetical protein